MTLFQLHKAAVRAIDSADRFMLRLQAERGWPDRDAVSQKDADKAKARLEARRKGVVSRQRRMDKDKPPWERRDGRSHVVYMTHAKNKGGKAMTGWWVWQDGHATMCFEKKEEAPFACCHREIFVWAVEDWEEWKKQRRAS